VNDHKGFDGDLRAQLLPGENSLSVADLRVPKRFTSATSFFSVVIFVRLFDELRNRFKMQEVRRQLNAIQVPIARRMVVCVTEQRILIWKQSTWHSKRSYLGSVEGRRIRAAQLERSTHVKWNVITLQILDGRQIRLLIDQPSAQQFARALNGNADDQKFDPEITAT
jgi:hypothetical protein